MEKKCYIYLCDRYPHCEKAAGNCCAIEFDSMDGQVTEEECGKDKGYPLFEEKKRKFFNPQDL